MANITTLNDTGAQLRPRPQTLRNILNYSRSLEIIDLKRTGVQLEMNKN